MKLERIRRPRGGWTAVTLAAALLAVEAVIVAESWRGLTGFAHLIGITGPAAWGVPVTLDGVSLVAALVALRAELAGESSGLYRMTLFAFTAASAAANWWHGRHAGGTQAALYLGGMSVAVALVFALALRQIRAADRRSAGRVTAQLPRFSAAHWARYPTLTWRAWSLAVRDGHASPRDALDAALSAHPAAAPRTPESAPAPEESAPAAAPAPVPGETRQERPARSRSASRKRAAPAKDPRSVFAPQLASGTLPTDREVRVRMGVGSAKASAIRADLERELAGASPNGRSPGAA